MSHTGPAPRGAPVTASEFNLDVNNSALEGAADSAAFALMGSAERTHGRPGRSRPAEPVQVRTLIDPLMRPGAIEIEEVGWSQFAALTDMVDLPPEVDPAAPKV